jgi:hypothetical protein
MGSESTGSALPLERRARQVPRRGSLPPQVHFGAIVDSSCASDAPYSTIPESSMKLETLGKPVAAVGTEDTEPEVPGRAASRNSVRSLKGPNVPLIDRGSGYLGANLECSSQANDPWANESETRFHGWPSEHGRDLVTPRMHDGTPITRCVASADVHSSRGDKRINLAIDCMSSIGWSMGCLLIDRVWLIQCLARLGTLHGFLTKGNPANKLLRVR